MKNLSKSKIIRLSVQAFFLVLIIFIAISHQLNVSSAPSLHSVCPFGGVVSAYSLITEGSFVQKIHESSFVILSIVLFLGVLFGPVFCGWICPLGTVQEWIGNLGRKIFKKKYNKFIPYKYDKYLRFLRYGVLIWVVYMTAKTGELLFNNIDPYFALFNFWTSEAAVGGIIVLGVTLLSSLFVERPWCKYACPFGALLGLTNFIRIFKIRRNPKTCINCSKCDNACPMNINISNNTSIRDHQCISCLKCTSEVACPINDTVNLKTKGGK